MQHRLTRFGSRTLVLGSAVLAVAALLPSVAAAHPEPYEWVALGDSYTAGGFIGDPRPALTDRNRDGCDRTTNAYPDVVDRELAEFPPGMPVELTNVSCGNATIADIAKTDQTPISPVEPPAGGWSPVPTQVTRGGLDADTDVVTIGVGGNSLPFGTLIGTCLAKGLALGTCEDHFTNPAAGEENIDERIQRVEGEYIEMLATVHASAPNAKVITIGYPAIVPADVRDCTRGDITQFGTTKLSDLEWLRGVLQRLNTTIRTVTDFFGDQYVDIHSSSEGHDVCQPDEDQWVEGICGDAAEYWPASMKFPGILLPLNCGLVGKRVTLVHPNAEGHTNTAYHVERAIRVALLSL